MTATRTGARARASSPAGVSPRSKNASTPFADVNTNHAYRARSGTSKSTGAIAIAGSSTTSAPSSSSSRPELARLLTRTGHHDRAPEQRPLLEPREVEPGDVADDDRGRGFDTRGRDGPQRRPRRALLGARAPAHRGHGRLGRAAAAYQRVGDVGDPARAHEDHEGPAGARERVPVGVGGALRRVLVARHDRHARRRTPVRDRDAGVHGRGDRARDARNDLERHAGGDARLRFLATATEDEGIAALQPHDRRTGAAALDEQRVDLVLRHLGASGRLADVDELGGGRRELQQRGRREAVVDDDVGGAEQRFAAAGEQARVAGTGADEVDGHATKSSAAKSARRRDRRADRSRPRRRPHRHPHPRPACAARRARRAMRAARPS